MYTLTDTVGFVRHLPHDLVEAFASTLEESTQADLLVHVVDGSDPDPVGQIDAVRAVLADIGAAEIRELIVINKVDRRRRRGAQHAAGPLSRRDVRFRAHRKGHSSSYGRPSSRCCLGRRSRFGRSSRTSAVTWSTAFTRPGEFLSTEHTVAGTLIVARVNPSLAGELAPYELVTSDRGETRLSSSGWRPPDLIRVLR